MSAEEVALEEIREAVDIARLHRHKANDAETFAAKCFWRASSRGAAFQAKSIARIIRAIRAERTTPSLEWIDLRPAHEPMREMLALSYEQGRSDALRGVQGACLFMAEATDQERPWDPAFEHAVDAYLHVADEVERAVTGKHPHMGRAFLQGARRLSDDGRNVLAEMVDEAAEEATR